jgi:hypothetical protein
MAIGMTLSPCEQRRIGRRRCDGCNELSLSFIATTDFALTNINGMSQISFGCGSCNSAK